MGEPDALRVVLVGHGRMGQIVESMCPSYHCQVVGWLDDTNNIGGSGVRPDAWPGADVAIDFSIAPAFVENFPRLAALGVDVVVGTTGWQSHEQGFREVAARTGIGVVAAPNFSVGVALFEAIAGYAARLFSDQPQYGAWLHEIHHAAKRDAPSGTALAIKSAMERAGFARPIDVASSRAGSIPGTHTVGFDGPCETVTLSHATRDRATFAHGALLAARWIHGRKGWYGIRDVLGLTAVTTEGEHR